VESRILRQKDGFPGEFQQILSPLERLVGTFVRSTFLDGRGADLEAVETFDGGAVSRSMGKQWAVVRQRKWRCDRSGI
jgi:hypothetical protein